MTGILGIIYLSISKLFSKTLQNLFLFFFSIHILQPFTFKADKIYKRKKILSFGGNAQAAILCMVRIKLHWAESPVWGQMGRRWISFQSKSVWLLKCFKLHCTSAYDFIILTVGNILFPISFASFLVIIYESLANNPIYFIPLWNVWYILGDITIVILNNLITDPGSGNARQMEMIALGWNLEVLLFHPGENCLSVYCFTHKMHGEDRASLLLIRSSHSCTFWFLQQDFSLFTASVSTGSSI